MSKYLTLFFKGRNLVRNNIAKEEKLRDSVTKSFNVPWIKIISKSRNRNLMDARHAYCYLAYANGNTLVNIGRIINREHSTVIRSVRKVKALYDINDPVVKIIEEIKTGLAV